MKNSCDELIPFMKTTIIGNELDAISTCFDQGKLSGGGEYSEKVISRLQEICTVNFAYPVHSCTAALEASCLALDLGPGDEVIIPSYNFPSAASAIALRGATPVFIDVNPDTMNIDEKLIENAINEKTKAICPVHYAGVAAEMDHICALSQKYSVAIIEDAAQSFLAYYKGRHLGSLGDLGAISFHATKNINCGEGGAILTNNTILASAIDEIIEKGTNRRDFFKGRVSNYYWMRLGSSYIMSDINAAMLTSQISVASKITEERVSAWQYYYDALSLILPHDFRLPVIPPHCKHNGHLFYVVLENPDKRSKLISRMAEKNIQVTTHFEPLHLSPAGKRFGRISSNMDHTERMSSGLIRLPLWNGIKQEQQDRVIEYFLASLKAI